MASALCQLKEIYNQSQDLNALCPFAALYLEGRAEMIGASISGGAIHCLHRGDG
jgi:hypothetical protein